MTTIGAARDLLIAEGYAPEDVETSLANLENEGLENPRQDVANSWDQELEDAEIQTVREQIVSVRGVDIDQIAAAFDAADIEYKVVRPGSTDAAIWVGGIDTGTAYGPAWLDSADGANGLGINSWSEGSSDWHATIEDAVMSAADNLTVVTTILADGTEQVVDLEPITKMDWKAVKGTTLSVGDTGGPAGQAYRVELVAGGLVVDSYETTAQ